jgi:hypothetical protein
MAQDYKLTSLYGKPLLRGLGLSPENALNRVKYSVLRRLRDKLVQSTFSERAKKALAKSLRVEVGPSSLTLYSKHPAFTHLMRGQRKGQMRWLTRARAPIPIITEEGKLIFRSATIKSMKDGKWVHPGRPPYDFIERAKKEARTQIRKAIVSEVTMVARNAAKKVIRMS